MPEFLTYCLARYGQPVNPVLVREGEFLKQMLRYSVQKALDEGRLNEAGRKLALEYLNAKPA